MSLSRCRTLFVLTFGWCRLFDDCVQSATEGNFQPLEADSARVPQFSDSEVDSDKQDAEATMNGLLDS